MYVDRSGHGYYRGTEQCHTRARFLILMEVDSRDSSPPGPDEKRMRAIVRKVAMRQCGHFMMGVARIKGHSITLSGSYGGDGLPCRVPREVFLQGTPVPDDLYEAWNKGGGHNCAGSEAPAMREWALRVLVPKKVEHRSTIRGLRENPDVG